MAKQSGRFFNEKSGFISFRSIPPMVEMASSTGRSECTGNTICFRLFAKSSGERNVSFVEKALIIAN